MLPVCPFRIIADKIQRTLYTGNVFMLEIVFQEAYGYVFLFHNPVFFQEPVDIMKGITDEQVYRAADKLGFTGNMRELVMY